MVQNKFPVIFYILIDVWTMNNKKIKRLSTCPQYVRNTPDTPQIIEKKGTYCQACTHIETVDRN